MTPLVNPTRDASHPPRVALCVRAALQSRRRGGAHRGGRHALGGHAARTERARPCLRHVHLGHDGQAQGRDGRARPAADAH
eukprot:543145-Prymnesium_polylepis.2